MGIHKKIIHVTISANRESVPLVLKTLKEAGLGSVNTAAARKVQLHENSGLIRLISPGKSLVDLPTSLFTFCINSEAEKPLINHIIQKCEFNIPDRGSVFSREVTLLAAHSECLENRVTGLGDDSRSLQSSLVGITCIVQKSEGNVLGRVGLDTGCGVPTITYGEGTGLRDKLGLWRITIPAEKEIVTLVVTPNDAENIFDLMISVGGLDKPGRGFIYLFPVSRGLIDTQIHLGITSQAASAEQIISAIDEIKGTTEWRRRQLSGAVSGKPRRFLNDLVNLTLICNEGRGSDLVMAAMKAGAPGATISKVKFMRLAEGSENPISPAREKAEMIVSASQVGAIAAALENAGALDDATCGQIYFGSVPKACTYLGKPA